ncbi:sugar phosphate isomerase [Prauserella marina]|uniref:Sugar phosphate isomerase/epimerase n=1 Tax=Prauserella marina TaxID=530584 RepID=A0A222VPM2_9PSEU|nr:sugar phosphate isomerase/epimerase family protein [Prauserella marina]ASR35834.1 sugar phosphate isomerase [Prauserella marina]PWV84254.1 sugar phosphate isomerase/epimerase [Prauserella marina]SDC26944.1 Sugar phosphate isomerase/epimerase [Prauserella marina]
MAIGLSTYAFFWRGSSRAGKPLTLTRMLEQTRELGVDVFQICDHPPLEQLSTVELRELRAAARDLGVTLELGTRGVRPGHLRHYLDLAEALDVTLVRGMLYSATDRPTLAEATEWLREAMPGYAERGVTLALETYEQVTSADLVDVVEAVGSDHLGICLDPANCVANLEHPRQVVETTARHVANLHVKDFDFARQPGWVGFTLSGCKLGEGRLDYGAMIERVRPGEKNINQIVEHWLPPRDDFETTCVLEDEWTRHSVEFLRSNS